MAHNRIRHAVRETAAVTGAGLAILALTLPIAILLVFVMTTLAEAQPIDAAILITNEVDLGSAWSAHPALLIGIVVAALFIGIGGARFIERYIPVTEEEAPIVGDAGAGKWPQDRGWAATDDL